MTPEAFEALVLRLSTTVAFQHITNSCKVRQQVTVGLYRLGCSGNGDGVCDIAFACGCNWGSVDAWSRRMVDGLYELNQEVVTFATEDEGANASAWVVEKSGVEEWGWGWLVADGTHIKLAWKPALHARGHFPYQGNYLFNVSLVFLPHSLCIVKSIVGHPGSSHNLCVWASGDNGIVAKPCLHLDEGEFVWVDAGFGFSAFSVGPFNNNTASKSCDIRYFNYFLSHVWICAEHGIAYLKNRFQCLMGYHGNLYHEEDHERAAYTIQACIVAHTFASQYDHPDDMADYLLQSFSEEDIADVTSGLPLYHQATEEARIM
ncbi:uncharacterized protein UBRO_20801 [Ustilago bromivora]|uniref:DDE Tnp4 domain-containing protein n=1 Tax=Ustilago bromivora TaxID=307758 RepID=A0A1K0HH29_9BASI|nr:uncharacterized protein UBRO_20801 [Ustilago bromivora]